MFAVGVVYVDGAVGRERERWAKSSMAAQAERSEERAGEVEVEGYDQTDKRSTNARGLG